MSRNSIKEDLKENFISEEEYWQYNKEYSDKSKKINELNRLLIDELIENIVVSEDGNIKVIFKYEDKYFEALDFINRQKCDIIASS